MNLTKKLFFILIISLSFFVRFFQIDRLPYGLLPDEASIGYNAYSILVTGRDEHNKKFPLVFEAFGDQKLPLYIYLTVPVIKLFDLSNFSPRFVAGISGVIFILLIFKLTRILGFGVNQSPFASTIVSISPWTIMLSRLSFEASLGLVLFSSGLYFLVRNKSKNDFFISLLFFSLTFFSYIPYRFVSPLLSLFITQVIQKNRFRSFI
ncbi:MAG: glycosyltransferase family 39 protein [Patescibacteria group bacterium]|nr:glycosyltransferase family 39 protein [Patescibacteria group bacterium]